MENIYSQLKLGMYKKVFFAHICIILYISCVDDTITTHHDAFLTEKGARKMEAGADGARVRVREETDCRRQ